MITLALLEALGLMKSTSSHGVLIDNMLSFVHWFMLVLFVGWGSFLLYVIWRFHKSRSPKANYYGARTHLSTHLEIAVIVTEVMLLIAFALPVWSSRANAHQMPLQAENPIFIRCVGEQFFWNFHYQGKDGQWGEVAAEYFSGGNGLGLNPNNAAAQDDFVVVNTMTIPVNRPVVVQITSKDVIHNFALHPMRVAQDAIPGLEIPTWFTPIEEGMYEIVCGQLCGSGHYLMRGFVEVVSEEKYAEFLEAQHKNSIQGKAAAAEAQTAAITAGNPSATKG